MFEYVRGKLAQKRADAVIVDVSGVGYYLSAPLSTISALPEPGADVKLLTYFHTNDRGAQQLFGFATEEERDIFISLKSVTKVGPKLALAVLSRIPPSTFGEILNSEDVTVLTSVPGVGKKTASQIILDLKNKLPQLMGSKPKSAVPEEALLALESLGYSKYEIGKIVEKLSERFGVETLAELSTEDVIRHVLQAGSLN